MLTLCNAPARNRCCSAQSDRSSMAVLQLPPDVLRVGEPTPFALRDQGGRLLIPRGTLVASELQLQQLAARDLYVDEQDGGALQRAMAGKLDTMVRQGSTSTLPPTVRTCFSFV